MSRAFSSNGKRVVELRQWLEANAPQRPQRPGRRLVKRSVWMIGGDGWAYDIGYGGLDHCWPAAHDVNIAGADTRGVYSNTGGQMSKGERRWAQWQIRPRRQATAKKDLGLMR